MEVAVCEIEELDGDFGSVGGDLGVGEEEMEETGIARFEGRVGGDVVCGCGWGVAVGSYGEGIIGCGGVGVFQHGVHLHMHPISHECER